MIPHAKAQRGVADQLRGLEQVTVITLTHMSRTVFRWSTTLPSIQDKVVGFAPRACVDILPEDRDVDTVLGALRTNIGRVGGSVVFGSQMRKAGVYGLLPH